MLSGAATACMATTNGKGWRTDSNPNNYQLSIYNYQLTKGLQSSVQTDKTRTYTKRCTMAYTDNVLWHKLIESVQNLNIAQMLIEPFVNCEL